MYWITPEDIGSSDLGPKDVGSLTLDLDQGPCNLELRKLVSKSLNSERLFFHLFSDFGQSDSNQLHKR